MEPIRVGMAEYKVVTDPAVLISIGLGSCIGIVLYDNLHKIGGLAHIMLPHYNEAKDRSNPVKFADVSIDLMLEDMEKIGASRKHIKAKIFGGANMFPNIESTTLMNIGQRNIKAVTEELQQRDIIITAQDLGGHCGRTIVFDLKDGSVLVKNVKGESKIF